MDVCFNKDPHGLELVIDFSYDSGCISIHKLWLGMVVFVAIATCVRALSVGRVLGSHKPVGGDPILPYFDLLLQVQGAQLQHSNSTGTDGVIAG